LLCLRLPLAGYNTIPSGLFIVAKVSLYWI
jgi:hypothetical protein